MGECAVASLVLPVSGRPADIPAQYRPTGRHICTVPADRQTYLHSTGRFYRVGVSISFAHNQKSWNQLRQIEECFGAAITKVSTRDVEINSIRDGVGRGYPQIHTMRR